MGGCISGRAGEEVAEVGPGGELVGYQHGPVLAKENDVVVLGLPRPRTLSSSRDAFDVSSTEEASEGEEEEDRLFKAKSVRRSKRIEELEAKSRKSQSRSSQRRSVTSASRRSSSKAKSIRKSSRVPIEYTSPKDRVVHRKSSLSRKSLKTGSKAPSTVNRLSSDTTSSGPMNRSWDRVQKVMARKSGESPRISTITEMSGFIDA
mmetsp:Transcript_5686/g.10199  ORF Transcript_5686/g.10199 Transcript_5686/m.10199 type:complete len:205 (+) Transcript_5686:316-930(+)|eukprot:CAMPEP_0184522998 /NCGR_PEP_ID=MMETSP0198_2-20121128/8624_1 /TAXON_ID=1112570 /ORGANISM="Thraustochytrium sp., Strain LLF1b" /LENGTH=204 /DNA_ID=CAMNT_0026913949 /DNA_START=291 /DNA_END=905 /DNA_ORIENTATION=+